MKFHFYILFYHSIWIEYVKPVPWSSKSPDSIPINFFDWWFFKERVYGLKINTEENCKHRKKKRSKIMSLNEFRSRWNTGKKIHSDCKRREENPVKQ